MDFPRGLVRAEITFGFTKRDADAYLTDRRGHRNTLRLFRICFAWKYVYARYAWPPLQERQPFVFHTSNIQRARMKRLARPIVHLGNPILKPPEGRLDYGRCNDKTHNGTICFSGATARFRSPAPLFSPFFSGKTEKNGPPEAASLTGKKAGLKTPFRKPSAKNFAILAQKKPAARAAGQNARIKEEYRSTRARAWRCC